MRAECRERADREGEIERSRRGREREKVRER